MCTLWVDFGSAYFSIFPKDIKMLSQAGLVASPAEETPKWGHLKKEWELSQLSCKLRPIPRLTRPNNSVRPCGEGGWGGCKGGQAPLLACAHVLNRDCSPSAALAALMRLHATLDQLARLLAPFCRFLPRQGRWFWRKHSLRPQRTL